MRQNRGIRQFPFPAPLAVLAFALAWLACVPAPAGAAAPPVLLDLPGWRLAYVDEQTEHRGEVEFWRTASHSLPRDPHRIASLSWRRGPLARGPLSKMRPAAGSARVLGRKAEVRYRSSGRGDRQMIARWSYRGRVLAFTGFVSGPPAMRALLAGLRAVEPGAWRSALPSRAVPPREHGATVVRMLREVPLPPGFEPASVPGAGLTKDRYQLGAAVTGSVSCRWFERWSEAVEAGDEVARTEAIEAMASAERWPVMRAMTREGDYPEAIEAFAAAMPEGTWFGRPLASEVQGGLGCAAYGVHLDSMKGASRLLRVIELE